MSSQDIPRADRIPFRTLPQFGYQLQYCNSSTAKANAEGKVAQDENGRPRVYYNAGFAFMGGKLRVKITQEVFHKLNGQEGQTFSLTGEFSSWDGEWSMNVTEAVTHTGVGQAGLDLSGKPTLRRAA